MKMLIAATVLSLGTTLASAQNPPATPVPAGLPPAASVPGAPPAAPLPPRAAAQPNPRNVRFDITITDGVGARPVVKNLSLTATDGPNYQGGGSIRNNARLPGSDPNVPAGFVIQDKEGKQQTLQPLGGPQSVPLNIDVTDVRFVSNDFVRASVRIEYQPYVPDAKTQPAVITASANVAFQDGRKTTVLQTVDPITDRRTTIEVTATILK